MLEIRLSEERIAAMHLKKEITGPVHLYTGQEAIAAGVCAHLNKDDYVFSNHRSHGHFIAKGACLEALFAELFGRLGGCSKGKGGSMHLVDTSVGYMGSSSIVAGNIPICVGVGLALKLKRSRNISVCFFGDGAVDEGAFYESLNFASLKDLPVFFVCENNFYAICSHQSKRQKNDDIYKRSIALGVPAKRLDGNDVLEIEAESARIIKSMRRQQGPYLIECRTYRWMSHAGPKEDTHLGYRCQEELDYWKSRCPIKRMEGFLFKKNIITKQQSMDIRSDILGRIDQAVSFARRSPAPASCDLLEDVTSKRILKVCA